MLLRLHNQKARWLLRLFWGLTAILCSTAALGESRVAGRYILQSADGKELPAVVAENKAGGYQLEVVSGWVVLGAGRSFTWHTAYRTTENTVVRRQDSEGKGTYGISGDTLSLTPEGSSAALEGTLKHNTLTIKADVNLVYQREKEIEPK